MNRLIYEMKVAARQAPRLYFAPFVGAVNAMTREMRAMRPVPTVGSKANESSPRKKNHTQQTKF